MDLTPETDRLQADLLDLTAGDPHARAVLLAASAETGRIIAAGALDPLGSLCLRLLQAANSSSDLDLEAAPDTLVLDGTLLAAALRVARTKADLDAIWTMHQVLGATPTAEKPQDGPQGPPTPEPDQLGQ